MASPVDDTSAHIAGDGFSVPSDFIAFVCSQLTDENNKTQCFFCITTQCVVNHQVCVFVCVHECFVLCVLRRTHIPPNNIAKKL